MAQNACPQLQANAQQCHSSWRNMGGGSSGQAGSFKQCYEMYCQAMIAAGCSTPSFCP
jgi:hypothetical protein